jgi:hypothetical protein
MAHDTRNGRPVRGRLVTLVTLVTLAACDPAASAPGVGGQGAGGVGGDGGGGGGGAPACVGLECPPSCAEGFEAASDGLGCVPIFAEGCGAGTRPALGEASCVPVGAPACEPGFTPSALGFGCEPVLPAAPCVGATRDALGEASCVPLGPCDDDADGDVIVDDDFGPGELDATHFATVTAALAAAPTGGTVVVRSGTYVEALVLERPVTLRGACAAWVELVSPGDDEPGALVQSPGVRLEGLTLRGHLGGVLVEGGEATLAASLVEGARGLGLLANGFAGALRVEGSVVRALEPGPNGELGWGASAQGQATLELVDSAVVGARHLGVFAAQSDSVVRLERSVVRGVLEHAGQGVGVAALVGGRAELEGSAVVDGVGYALSVSDAGSSASVVGSSLVGTGTLADGTLGRGAQADLGASLVVEGSTLARVHEVGLAVTQGATVIVRDTTVEGTLPNGDGDFGAGAVALPGGELTLERVAVVASRTYGLAAFGEGARVTASASLVSGVEPGTQGLARGVSAQDGASLELDDSALVAAHTNGALVDGQAGASFLSLSGSLVLDSEESGVFVRSGGEVTLERSAVVRAREAAVYLSDATSGEGQRGRATLTDVALVETRPTPSGHNGGGLVSGGVVTCARVTVRAAHAFGLLLGKPGATLVFDDGFVSGTLPMPSDGSFGDGLVALEGALAVVRRSRFSGHARIGLAFDDAGGLLEGCLVDDNAVGVHAQHGTTLVEALTSPGEASPGALVVTHDTRFVENASKVGSGEVPVPAF